MDINTLRIAVTVVSFMVFCGIVSWAWSKRSRTAFEEAANQPIADDDLPESGTADKAGGESL
jgi:cytochrome c oxidase cbb3-type subunit IV